MFFSFSVGHALVSHFTIFVVLRNELIFVGIRMSAGILIFVSFGRNVCLHDCIFDMIWLSKLCVGCECGEGTRCSDA